METALKDLNQGSNLRCREVRTDIHQPLLPCDGREVTHLGLEQIIYGLRVSISRYEDNPDAYRAALIYTYLNTPDH